MPSNISKQNNCLINNKYSRTRENGFMTLFDHKQIKIISSNKHILKKRLLAYPSSSILF